MRKREREALRRLEEALLTQDDNQYPPSDEDGLMDRTWQELSAGDCAVYNTDSTDVDMTAYSEDVHRGRRKRPFRIFFRVLLFAAVLWILLRFLGVI